MLRNEAPDGQDWIEVYERLRPALLDTTASVEDLELLAVAAQLVGRDGERAAALERAHQSARAAHDLPRAARSAFWLGITHLQRGELAQGGGWLARARRALEESGADCAEQGYLLLPAALERAAAGDHEGARVTFHDAAAIGERFGDPDLVTLARHGEGRALIGLGNVAAGVALLDEVMVAVTVGDLSPIVTGIVYCSVIEACHEIHDLRRAQEWTAALTRWCDAQPGVVPFRGRCLVYRAEIMQLHGEWPHAMDEARRAQELLSSPPPDPVLGMSLYQQAELHRLRGEFTAAEDAYREASRWGRPPEPGLALLRLAQGRVDAAEAAIRRVLDEASERVTRSRLLPAFVEIVLAAGDLAAARTGAEELESLSRELDAPALRASAAWAEGAVLLAEGERSAALTALRRSWSEWQQLEAPYEGARVRVDIARACRELGDLDTAALELDAARWTFEQLGAASDLAALAALAGFARGSNTAGLTARELEVVRLVARGLSNRAIASELVISEKTVARHVSNILAKLELPSRAAATAYAYKRGLM